MPRGRSTWPGNLVAVLAMASAPALAADHLSYTPASMEPLVGFASAFGQQMPKMPPLKPREAVVHWPDGASGPTPAVLMVHGTAGPDSRYRWYRPALLDAGWAVVEADFRSGVYTSAANLPPLAWFQAQAWGLLHRLQRSTRIDDARIAIMGFSLGGSIAHAASFASMESLFGDSARPGFAAYASIYPVCRVFSETARSRRYTGRPKLLLIGERDSYGDRGRFCRAVTTGANSRYPGLIELKIYPGVDHGFDRAEPPESRFADARTGEMRVMKFDRAAARDARDRVIAFLRRAFRPGASSGGVAQR